MTSSVLQLNRAQFGLVGEQGTDKFEVQVWADKFGSANALNTATITHKFMDMLSVSFGHMGYLMQSWENDYDTIDEYMFSLANGKAFTTSNNGIQANASFGDHALALQVLQGESSTTIGKNTVNFTNNKGGLTTSLQYRGEINKMIRPLITYSMVKPSSSNTTYTDSANKSHSLTFTNLSTQLGVGVQVAVASATIDAEYDSVSVPKYTVDTVDTKAETVSSIVLQGKYAMGMTSPFLKITVDSDKLGADSNVGDIAQTQVALGVEHKLDQTCRLHAVFFNQAQSIKADSSNTTKVSSNNFNLGVTASI